MIACIPLFRWLIFVKAAGSEQASGSLAGVLGLASGMASALFSYYKFLKSSVSSLTTRIAATVGAAIYLYGMFVLAYWLAVVVLYVPDLLPLSKWWVQVVGLSLVVVAVAVGSYPNINYVGLHRYYRDRLMEAFLPRDTAVVAMRSLRSPGADVLSMEALAPSSRPHAKAETGSIIDAGPAPKPYPLINTNVILIKDD